MSFLADDEVATLKIERMIFHIVGKGDESLVYLKEITPLVYEDFFLERIKRSLNGNTFKFNKKSNVERILRLIENNANSDPECFTRESKELATDFHSNHKGNASKGAFFVFELSCCSNQKLFALIKYENEEVVRYYLEKKQTDLYQPKMEKFNESFVKKAEAVQKVALVRLKDGTGGDLTILDRSKRSHISEYFETFLSVTRVNTADDLTEKLFNVLKSTLKDHTENLPEDIVRNGIHRLYSHLCDKPFDFDTSDAKNSLAPVFGQLEEDSPVIKTFNKRIKDLGFMGESFTINPSIIEKPKKRKIVTKEGIIIIYDETANISKKPIPGGGFEIKIHTAGIKTDDIEC